MTMVGLDFSLPGSAAVHSVTGAVVRCEQQTDGSFELAVYFTELQPDTRTALGAFVSKGQPAP